MVSKPNSNKQREILHARVRNKVSGTTERPRLNVYRSLNNIYAQVIDDTTGCTLVSASSLDEEVKSAVKSTGNKEAAKAVGTEFLSSRPNDNIGLVIFAGESYTLCPLTTDKKTLVNLMGTIKEGMMDEDGTAIGMGLANAVNRLKDSQAKSKVIILLTDGTNNRGEIDPMTASELAKAFGIRVYTIGVGTKGEAPYPVQTIFGIQKQMVPVEIDEETLEAIAEKTGGHYFRATNNNSLKAIYNDIDKMEKTKIKVTEHTSKNEEYLPYAMAAILLLLLEILLRNTILRHIP